MRKKNGFSEKLLGFKLKAFNRPDICSYGTVLGSRASKVTSGANGYNTECETTYKVFVK